MMFCSTVRRAFAVAAWCLMAALCACGPGVVGTGAGTGGDDGDDIPFTPLRVCDAPFQAASLACAEDADGGTAPVRWADANKSNEGAAALALIEGQTMALEVACFEAQFLGTWGQLQDGSTGFVGRYVARDAPFGRPAIVRVEPAADPPDAVGWLQVDDGSGSTLFGPWLVRRVEGAVGFADCPP